MLFVSAITENIAIVRDLTALSKSSLHFLRYCLNGQLAKRCPGSAHLKHAFGGGGGGGGPNGSTGARYLSGGAAYLGLLVHWRL
jgi:hypothetical protein